MIASKFYLCGASFDFSEVFDLDLAKQLNAFLSSLTSRFAFRWIPNAWWALSSCLMMRGPTLIKRSMSCTQEWCLSSTALEFPPRRCIFRGVTKSTFKNCKSVFRIFSKRKIVIVWRRCWQADNALATRGSKFWTAKRSICVSLASERSERWIWRSELFGAATFHLRTPFVFSDKSFGRICLANISRSDLHSCSSTTRLAESDGLRERERIVQI